MNKVKEPLGEKREQISFFFEKRCKFACVNFAQIQVTLTPRENTAARINPAYRHKNTLVIWVLEMTSVLSIINSILTICIGHIICFTDGF